mmetsp:Transcript_26396/g.66591  ORF Transcript_26396/g.66591 Transcript_26396/m.66591 type:complete len:246 (-) Transcript_26396:3444-4181(-)
MVVDLLLCRGGGGIGLREGDGGTVGEEQLLQSHALVKLGEDYAVGADDDVGPLEVAGGEELQRVYVAQHEHVQLFVRQKLHHLPLPLVDQMRGDQHQRRLAREEAVVLEELRLLFADAESLPFAALNVFAQLLENPLPLRLPRTISIANIFARLVRSGGACALLHLRCRRRRGRRHYFSRLGLGSAGLLHVALSLAPPFHLGYSLRLCLGLRFGGDGFGNRRPLVLRRRSADLHLRGRCAVLVKK